MKKQNLITTKKKKNTTGLKVSNLTVSNENGVNAIKNVSFEVNEGDFLGIISIIIEVKTSKKSRRLEWIA